MTGFKIANHSSEIKLNNEWIQNTKFNSKDRLVDKKGRRVDSPTKVVHIELLKRENDVFLI